MTTLTPTTELEAVNLALSNIGEAPVNTLENPGVLDATKAKSILDEVTREVQSEGWHFNTDINYPMSPSDTGEILIGEDILLIRPSGVDRDRNIVMRGNRLYDGDDHTYTFTKDLTVDRILLLQFTDLPQAARQYIAVRAARIFQVREVASGDLYSFNLRDEAKARADLKRNENRRGKPNALTGNLSSARIMQRRYN
jgi:hypothetical protein